MLIKIFVVRPCAGAGASAPNCALILVFGGPLTGWECVRLLVQKAWPWLTLSDMFFHLLVVHLLMPDVTLQIHLQKVAGVVLLACRYIPMFVRFLTRRASGVWEAIVAHLDWTIDDEVWCLSVEVDGKVFSVTKDAVWLVPRVLMRCLKGLAHVEARGGIACCVVRVLWWLSSVCSWAAAFGAMRQAAHLIVWLLPLLHAPSCPALEWQQHRRRGDAPPGRRPRKRRGARTQGALPQRQQDRR